MRRFFSSLWAVRPSPEELAWVARVLTPPELVLWERFRRYDQRHTLGVARRVEAALARTPWAHDSRWLAAALLHDVGKVEAGIGLVGRVAATLLRAVLGRERLRAWIPRGGWWGRIGRYSDHGVIGAALIRQAGGREEVARWAEAHHRVRRGHPPVVEGIPDDAVRALVAADRD